MRAVKLQRTEVKEYVFILIVQINRINGKIIEKVRVFGGI